MKLTVLIDNNTFINHFYQGEPALSFHIEDDDQQILFDTGYSDAYLKNARSMGLDFSTLTTVVLSHGHNDHTGGLPFLKPGPGTSLVAHPGVFDERFDNDVPISASLDKEKMEKQYEMVLSEKPVKIGRNFVFLGEIPVYFDFEKRTPMGIIKNGKEVTDDYILDDTALVYQMPEGIFIITGCSHSGICNIIEHAKRVTGNDNVVGVIGGFHLFQGGDRLRKTIDYFKALNMQLFPCHCVSFGVKAELYSHIPVGEVGVGLSLNVDGGIVRVNE